MADAVLTLKLDLTALNAGFKAALGMGQNFANQFNNLLSGKGLIDLQSFDVQLADYENKLKQASGAVLDVNEQPAVEGLTEAGKAAERSGQRIRKENLETAASFAQVVTGINSAIQMIRQMADSVSRWINVGVESEQANLKLTAALKNAGLWTEEYDQKLKAHIDSVRALTGVEDEYIKENTRMMLQIHAFSQDEIPGAIDAAVGLSKVFDTDLRNAMQMLARAAEGLPVRLAQYGVATKGAADATVSLSDLLEKGRQGYVQLGEVMDSNSGKIIQNKSNLAELFEQFMEFVNNALAPVVNLINYLTKEWEDNNAALKTAATFIGLMTVAIGSFIIVTKAAELATKAWALAQTLLNTAMKANPIFLIISLVIMLGTAIYALIKTNKDVAVAFGIVWKYAVASIKIMWEYIKGFWEFIKAFAGALAMTLALPYKIMYDTAKEIFSKIANIMKKLVKGDFKGVWDEITSGINVRAAESARMVVEQYSKAFNTLDGLGTRAREIWDHALDTTTKVKGAGIAAPDIKPGGGGGETDAQKAAREKLEQARLQALETYYNTLRWEAADYEKYMLAKYDDEAKAHAILTGDQAQADALYDARKRALTEDRLDWEKQIREQAIKDERAPFEAAKAQIEEHLARLQNWKELGLNVSQDLKTTWDDYFRLLKSRFETSQQQWINASSGKVAVSEEELARLNSIYEQDKDNYLAALDKKKQADLKAMDDTIRKWKESHGAAVQTINGIRSGFDTMWDSILDKSLTAKQRMDNIWKSMLGSWMNSAGKFVADWLEKQAYMVLMHGVFEKSKTAVTAVNEGVRTGIHRASVLEAMALDIWAAVKFVAIETWKAAASVFRFLAGVMGPLAAIVAPVVIAGIVAGIGGFRKGFKAGRYTGDGDPNKVAGAVHYEEYVFPAAATRGNVNELNWLMAALSGGIKLKDLIPGVRIPWQPVPQVAFSFAQGGQATGDMQSMVRAAMREELGTWKLDAEITVTDKIRIWLSKQAEKGSRLRRRLG